MLPLFPIGGPDIVSELVASVQDDLGGNAYDWHQKLVSSSLARSSNSTHFVTYVKIPARDTTEGDKLEVIPTLNKGGESHPGVSDEVGILHMELSSISEWFSGNRRGALLSLLPDLDKNIGSMNWTSPAIFARSLHLHRVHAVSATTNVMLTQLQLLSSARGNLMTWTTQNNVSSKDGPTMGTKGQYGLDLEAVVESILLPSCNLAVGLYYAAAFLQDDKEKKHGEVRKRRKEQKQVLIKQKRLNEQVDNRPHTPCDRTGLDDLTNAPAELRALEHSRDLLLAELETSLSALWAQADENVRNRQVAMWLDSLMHGRGSCVL